MADRVKPGPVDHAATVREAVSVHTKKIYDSCRDKDCLEDLRLYPDAASQAAIAAAIGIRAKSVELLHAGIAVEEAAFNRGYYTVDVRFFYRIRGEAYSITAGSSAISGLCVCDKRVLLFGSEGNAKVFSSDAPAQLRCVRLPVAVVDAVDPIILNIRLADVSEMQTAEFDQKEIPDFIKSAFPEGLVFTGDVKRVYVTLGQFSMIRLERDSQILIPAYDYCLPEKGCTTGSGDDPYELFKRIRFPVDEFFPPDTLQSCETYREAAAQGAQT